jgi:hypothetical protein
VRRIVANAALLTLMLAAVTSCTTTTEPLTFATQLASDLTVSPTTVSVGELVNAHWVIRNASHTDSLFRIFDPGEGASGFGLVLAATPANTVLGYQHGDTLIANDTRLVLPPRGSYTLDAVFKAVAAGTATVDACMPPLVGEGTEWTCVRKTVTVTAN